MLESISKGAKLGASKIALIQFVTWQYLIGLSPQACPSWTVCKGYWPGFHTFSLVVRSTMCFEALLGKSVSGHCKPVDIVMGSMAVRGG